MTTRLILRVGHPTLRQRANKVEKFDKQLVQVVEDMWETLLTIGGAGLAAPQIGESVRIITVIPQDEQRITLINPEIIVASKEELLGTEGCLSIPGVVGENIRRAATITIKGYDLKGQTVELQAKDWFARILQHEIDHLNGILYIDKLDNPEDLVFSLLPALEREMQNIISKRQIQAIDSSGVSVQIKNGEKVVTNALSPSGSEIKRSSKQAKGKFLPKTTSLKQGSNKKKGQSSRSTTQQTNLHKQN